jgi:hypothetical protein
MRILTPTIIANNESQPSTAGALLRIHDQDATSGESLLIVSSDDSDYYFKVASNGRVHFRGNATDGDGQIKVHLQHSGFTGAASSLIWDSSGGANQMSIRQSEENSDLFVYAHAQSLNLAEFARTTADVTFNAQVTVNGQGSDILDLYDNAATPVNVFKVQNDGAVHLGAYGSGTFTGTAAYTLAVDSSGNVIEITPTDANTTYDLTSAQSGTDVDITLTGSDATTDTVTLVAGDAITLTDDGSNNVTIATDGTSESTHIAVKNTSGSTITKGTPVYITGNVGSSDRLQIAPADASDSAKMPAVGLLETDLINNAEGYVVQGGYLRNLTTATIDGTSTSSNDTVYVKAGGGLTMTKPTGSTNYIQNIAKVARVGTASEGSLIVSSILRTNDIPNLADGQVWVGSTTYPVGTDFNLQEVTDGGNTTTNSIGIGVLSPSAFLEIANPTYSDATVLLGRQAGYPTIQGNGTSGGQWLMLDSNGGYLALNNHVTDNVILAWGGGDVAVGTGSPLARFHVKGSGNTSATTALLVENSSGTDTFKVLNDGQAQLGNYGSGTFTGTVSKVLAVESNGNIIETTLSDLSGVDGSGTANYLPKWSDSDTLTDSVMYDNGTYVGIGTTSPNNELEILGSNSPRISLRTSNEAVSEALELGFQVGTGANASSNSVGLIKSVITQATPSALIGDMEFQTNSGDAISTKMIIKGDGNMGIGTSTPSARTHISSSGNTSATNALLVENSDGTEIFKINDLGNTYVEGFLYPSNYIINNGGGDLQIANSGAVKFGVDGGGGVNSLTIQSSGGIQFNKYTGSTHDGTPTSFLGVDASGNVVKTTGSGVLTPTLQEVTDEGNTTTNDITIGGGGTTATDAVLILDGGNASGGEAYISLQRNSVGGFLLNHSDSSIQVRGTTDLPMYFYTNNSIKQTILSNGNIGIGTTTPGAKLEVNGGDIKITDTFPALILNGTTGGNEWSILEDSIGSLQFRENNDAKVTITDTGAVGIGTSSPSERLHIVSAKSGASGSPTNVGLIIEDNSSSAQGVGGGIIFKGNYTGSTSTTAGVIQAYKENNVNGDYGYAMTFHTRLNGSGSWAEKMRITSSGAVGIGTSSPSAKTHIVGSGNTSATTALLVENSDGDDLLKVNDNGSVDLINDTNGSSLVRIWNQSTGVNASTTLRLVSSSTNDNSAQLQFSESAYYTGSIIADRTNGFRVYNGQMNSPTEKLHLTIGLTGQLTFNTYTGTTHDGTPISFLGVDASGNVVKTTSSGVLTPTLQEVTDEGNSTTNDITIKGTDNILRLETDSVNGNKRLDFSVGADAVGRIKANQSASSLAFETTSTERMRITSTGSVGIGTSTPSAKLHIFDSGTSYTNLTEGITLSNNAGSTNDRLPSITWDYGTAGTPTFAAIETTRASSIGGNLVFHTAQTNGTLTEGMRITSTGAVGIGTSTPSASTHIVGSGNTSSTTALLVESNNGTDRLRVTDGSEVFVNASTLHYGADVAATTLGYKEFLTDVDYGTINTGAISVYTSESTRDTIMCDYKIYDGTNIRVGTVTATTDGTSVDYTDIMKAEVGDTSDMYFYAELDGSNLKLIFFRGSAGYDAKYIIKNF